MKVAQSLFQCALLRGVKFIHRKYYKFPSAVRSNIVLLLHTL